MTQNKHKEAHVLVSSAMLNRLFLTFSAEQPRIIKKKG